VGKQNVTARPDCALVIADIVSIGEFPARPANNHRNCERRTALYASDGVASQATNEANSGVCESPVSDRRHQLDAQPERRQRAPGRLRERLAVPANCESVCVVLRPERPVYAGCSNPVGVSPLVGRAGIRDHGSWHPCFMCLFRCSQRPPCCTLLVPQTTDRAMVEDHCQHGATRPKG